MRFFWVFAWVASSLSPIDPCSRLFPAGEGEVGGEAEQLMDLTDLTDLKDWTDMTRTDWFDSLSIF